MAVVMMRVVVMMVMVKVSVRSPSLILSDLVMHACDKINSVAMRGISCLINYVLIFNRQHRSFMSTPCV